MKELVNLFFILLISGLTAIGFTWICSKISRSCRWFCDALDWHHDPDSVELLGRDFVGECPRCKSKIKQSLSGNWSRLDDE